MTSADAVAPRNSSTMIGVASQLGGFSTILQEQFALSGLGRSSIAEVASQLGGFSTILQEQFAQPEIFASIAKVASQTAGIRAVMEEQFALSGLGRSSIAEVASQLGGSVRFPV